SKSKHQNKSNNRQHYFPDGQDREQQTQQETSLEMVTMKDKKDEKGKLGVHKALLQSIGKQQGIEDNDKDRPPSGRIMGGAVESAHTLLYCDKVLLIIMFAFDIRTATTLSTVFFNVPILAAVLCQTFGASQAHPLVEIGRDLHVGNMALYLGPSVVGMEKLTSNGNGYCPPKNNCKNPFSDTSIILLLVIDFQIKILHIDEYHRFLKLCQYWKENSDIRRYHSAQLMKFRRYSLIHYYAHEEMM
ncbi:hypothetical protein RFI_32765, partial [Reticulomyxa filosa]